MELAGNWLFLFFFSFQYFFIDKHTAVVCCAHRQGGWDGQGMQYEWERWKMHTAFWLENSKRREHSEDL